MVKRFLILFFIVICAYSCTDNYYSSKDIMGSNVVVHLQSDQNVKNSFDSDNNIAVWSENDKIGVIACCNGDFTDNTFHKFSNTEENSGSIASFEGYLTDSGAGEYQLFGVFPYESGKYPDSFSFNVSGSQFPDANSWDSSSDCMVAIGEKKYMESVSSSSMSLNYSHLVGWLRIDFSSFAISNPDYANETVKEISITSDSPIAGELDVVFYPKYKYSTNNATTKTVTLDYNGKGILLKNLNTFFSLLPSYSNKVTIKLNTNLHKYTFERKGMMILPGTISNTIMTKQEGDIIEYNPYPYNYYRTTLPDKPGDGESLNILLLGHSFGLNCSQYVPGLTYSAGISNVHFGRFYYAGCPLITHYQFFVNNTAYAYDYANCGGDKWISGGSRTLKAVLNETPWDIIIFQDGLKNEGDFSIIEEPLNNLIDGILETIYNKTSEKKPPMLVWNMFFPRYTGYHYGSEEEDWKHYCTAAQEVLSKTRVSLVIAAGTGLQNLRNTSLCTSETYHFTRESDHYHASNGAGSYAPSCTWFETLIKPIYGQTVIGNSFRVPLGTKTIRSGSVISSWDVVSDSNAELLQKCGAAAAENKYTITDVEGGD